MGKISRLVGQMDLDLCSRLATRLSLTERPVWGRKAITVFMWRRATKEEKYLRTERATNGRLGYATIYVHTSTKKNSDEEGKEKYLARQVLLLIDVRLVSHGGSNRPWPVRRSIRRSALFEDSINARTLFDVRACCVPYVREWNGRAAPLFHPWPISIGY